MMTCPSCRKRFKTGTLACPRCVTELLPPSMIELQDRHPELATVQPGHSRSSLRDSYVELLQCSLTEAKETSRLLESEGITCLIERDKEFQYDFRIEGGSHISDQSALILKVRSDELSKARALLAWEIQQESDEDPLMDDDEASILLRCPACDTETKDTYKVCVECGEALDSQNKETPAEVVYSCSACGASSNPQDIVCPDCGARFDH